MKQLHIRELLTYIIGSAIVVAVLNFLFQPDVSIQETIGRSLFMGLTLGVLYYFYDNRKQSKK